MTAHEIKISATSIGICIKNDDDDKEKLYTEAEYQALQTELNFAHDQLAACMEELEILKPRMQAMHERLKALGEEK